MTVSPTTFVAHHPEFSAVHAQHSALIQGILTQVEVRVSDSWGDERDEIVELEIAAAIAGGPMGRAAQLQAKDGSTTYSRELDRRKQTHACGHPCRVA
jgi:hypothetical protein